MAYKKLSGSELQFKNMGGVHVPLQPWPQTFYISRELFDYPSVEIRPLTVTGFIRGVSRNFVTMNFWRLCYLLYKAGFLQTPEGQQIHWKHLTLKFWTKRQAGESQNQ